MSHTDPWDLPQATPEQTALFKRQQEAMKNFEYWSSGMPFVVCPSCGSLVALRLHYLELHLKACKGKS